jgi:hypothetical protein
MDSNSYAGGLKATSRSESSIIPIFLNTLLFSIPELVSPYYQQAFPWFCGFLNSLFETVKLSIALLSQIILASAFSSFKTARCIPIVY